MRLIGGKLCVLDLGTAHSDRAIVLNFDNLLKTTKADPSQCVNNVSTHARTSIDYGYGMW